MEAWEYNISPPHVGDFSKGFSPYLLFLFGLKPRSFPTTFIMKNHDIILLLSLVTPVLLFNGCSTQAKITKTLSQSNPKLQAQTIKHCPREFTGWDLIKTFETKGYSLALCQQGDSIYLVGHEKQQHEAFIAASIVSQQEDLIIAQDEQGFSWEINKHELKVTQNNQLVARENILDTGQNQQETVDISSPEVVTEDNSESKLTEAVWQLQQIRYSNDELVEVDNPANYTIEFLPDGQLQIKADCNLARGTYTKEGSSLSIKIGPTTRAMCPPESISDRYLKELQAAVIFFFQDGNLYFDLKFDTGTMKFVPDNS